MKTILSKNIDGINIVTGFSKLQINPVETKKNFGEKIKSLPEFKEMEVLSSDYIKYRHQKDMEKDELENRLNKLKLKKEEISKKMGQDSDHIVYFEPKEGEKELSEAEYNEYRSLLSEAIKNENYLSFDKTEVPNLKGKEYFIDNNGVLEKKKISAIGIALPKDAILILNEVQKTEINEKEFLDRMLKMSKKEIDAEYSSKKKELIEHTQDKTTELRLEGATAAKAESDAIAEFKPKLDKLKLDYSQV